MFYVLICIISIGKSLYEQLSEKEALEKEQYDKNTKLIFGM